MSRHFMDTPDEDTKHQQSEPPTPDKPETDNEKTGGQNNTKTENNTPETETSSDPLETVAKKTEASPDTLKQLEQSWKAFRQTVIDRTKNKNRLEELKEELQQVRGQLKRASGPELEEARERERVIKEEMSDLQTQPYTPKISDPDLREWVMSSASSWENFLRAEGHQKPQGLMGKIKNWFSSSASPQEKMWEKMHQAWKEGK